MGLPTWRSRDGTFPDAAGRKGRQRLPGEREAGEKPSGARALLELVGTGPGLIDDHRNHEQQVDAEEPQNQQLAPAQ